MNVIIIPTYKPDQHLNLLVNELFALDLKQIIIVDDGSKEPYKDIFNDLEKVGCHVLHHDTNLGKGAAIKSGIEYANQNIDQLTGYITCDADGQHRSFDVHTISNALDLNPESLILGSRDLSLKNVPLKSSLGNKFSSFYFKLTTGVTCKDTQTGLRGIPLSMGNFALEIKENRYDFEMSFLTHIAKASHPILYLPIETTYINENSSSHFKPIIDSIRIYKKPIKFAISSILCAIVDLGIFTLLSSILNENIVILVIIATVSARIVSGILNFLLNRNWSFRSKGSARNQFKRYFALYILQLVLSIMFVTVLSFLPIHLTVIKLVVDSLLFIGSFFVQKHWVFKSIELKNKN